LRILLLPLLILGTLASYVAGLGCAVYWQTRLPLEYLISGALHASWILPATRRSGFALTATCWTATVWLAGKGIGTLYVTGSNLLLALLLEGVCLLLAVSLAPPEPWSERLARWRRARAEVAIQLRMGHGIVPWCRSCWRQFTIGAADTPVGSDYQRFAAALADAEHRLQVRLNRAAVPEQLRESILANAAAVVARSETAAAQRAIEVEQQALSAAAVCREQCERMGHLTAPERKALASQCEQVFLELIRY
jgi:hypothetical protein